LKLLNLTISKTTQSNKHLFETWKYGVVWEVQAGGTIKCRLLLVSPVNFFQGGADVSRAH